MELDHTLNYELDIVDKRSIDDVVQAKRCAICRDLIGEGGVLRGSKTSMRFKWYCSKCDWRRWDALEGRMSASPDRRNWIIVHDS